VADQQTAIHRRLQEIQRRHVVGKTTEAKPAWVGAKKAEGKPAAARNKRKEPD
jgi:hypothetical protein